ncbi:hypothetical protein DFH11DRAFT_1836750 [Phellopilus nigrolimitatus]|nr:hypothetical protein DFH11DRAFT_1836750 [Phellopilus nigrolimitatus]
MLGDVLDECVLSFSCCFDGVRNEPVPPPPRPRAREPDTNNMEEFPYTVAFSASAFHGVPCAAPDTHTIRLLMLPAVIMSAIHSCFGYMWTGHGMNVFNWGEGKHEYSALFLRLRLCCLVCIGKALDYALAKEGRFKVGEARPGADRTPAISKKDYDPADPARPADADVPAAGAATPRVRASCRVACWMRSSCSSRSAASAGTLARTCTSRRSASRSRASPFVAATLNSFAYNFAALDLLEASIKLVPGVGSPRGGVHLPAGPAAAAALRAQHGGAQSRAAARCSRGSRWCYDLRGARGGRAARARAGVVAARARRAVPRGEPARVRGERWHQLLRHTFVVFGGAPGAALAGAPGMALGAFLASGVYHELSSVAMGRGVDARVVAFFAAQGAFVILERVWRRVTGRRVGGWPGRVWLYFDIMVLGQPMIDAWHMKGLGGGRMIPPVISPTRQLLFPLLSRLTGYELNTYQP